MGRNRQGSSKKIAGPWSEAVAKQFDLMIESGQGLSRNKVAKATGIADSRFSALLNGGKQWYLEDVVAVCEFFGIGPVDFLNGLVLESKEKNPFDFQAVAGAA